MLTTLLLRYEPLSFIYRVINHIMLLRIKSILISKVAPNFDVGSGTLEALKWFAFICMAIDHLYKFLPVTQLQYVSPIGRLAVPLFAFVFGYSLRHFNFQDSPHTLKLLLRLLVTGVIAWFPYTYLTTQGFVFHLTGQNIMLMFLLAAIILWINSWPIKYSALITAPIFLIGGLFVEYLWAGLLMTIASYYFALSPNWKNLLVIIMGLFMLADINGNWYAFLVLPIIFWLPHADMRTQRIKHIFYVLYPLHMAAIIFIRFLMS